MALHRARGFFDQKSPEWWLDTHGIDVVEVNPNSQNVSRTLNGVLLLDQHYTQFADNPPLYVNAYK